MSDPAERYVLLALRLGRLDDGVVETYFGPPELSRRVAEEPAVAPSDLAHARAVERAAEPLRWVQVDAALMLPAEGLPEAEVGAHVHRWGLVDPDVAAHVIRFVTDPTSRS